MIDLTTWDLSIPTPSLISYITTHQLNNGYQSRYFKQNADGSVTFWSPVTGSASKGSGFPRSELRETHPNGVRAFWRYPEADNKISAVLTIDRVPSASKVVIGQIHSKDEPGSMRDPLLKIRYRQVDGIGRVEAVLRKRPGDKLCETTLLVDNVQPGDRFGYQARLTTDGQLRVVSSTSDGDFGKLAADVSPWKQQSLFFKAGAYVGDNSGSDSEGGQVTFHWLNTAHR